MSESLEGGCLCGAIRYRVPSESLMSALCHCSICRRASGAPGVSWMMFPTDQLEFTKGSPNRYASSKEATRGFCGHCGTALTFESEFMPGLVDVTVGSLDEPERMPPEMHIWDESRLDWFELADELPRHAQLPPQP